MPQMETWDCAEEDNILGITRLPDNATLPQRMSADAAGYDIYSALDAIVPPQEMVKVRTHIAIHPPKGTYGQLFSRSGLLT
jgi:dUTP pyrophosphatase